MPTDISLADTRRRAADAALAEALLRTDAVWREAYTATYARVYGEILAAEEHVSEKAVLREAINISMG
jgi:hypothetical protein